MLRYRSVQSPDGDGGEIMLRIVVTALLLFNFVLQGTAQMKPPQDIGIDEKLGAQVAMDVVLKDESGRDVTLRSLIDKPTILFFNYFRCPGICPVLINNLVDVVNRMPLEPGKDFRLVAVSFDPADTPGVAREKKANYLTQMRRTFPPDSWHFLTGTAENTKTIADSAGFNYRRQGDMYVHPGAIIMLTPKGVISRYLYGTTFVPADVAIGVKEAAGGEVIPTVSKMLSFCYTYDPAGRGYVLNVTRVAGIATLAVVAVLALFVLRRRSRNKEKSA
jgi:protein SCO1